jgi:hypothetical protein
MYALQTYGAIFIQHSTGSQQPGMTYEFSGEILRGRSVVFMQEVVPGLVSNPQLAAVGNSWSVTLRDNTKPAEEWPGGAGVSEIMDGEYIMMAVLRIVSPILNSTR